MPVSCPFQPSKVVKRYCASLSGAISSTMPLPFCLHWRSEPLDVSLIELSALSLSPFQRPFSRWTWFTRYQKVSVLHLVGAKDDGGGDNWSNAPVKMSPTNQHPIFYMQDAIPVAQLTVSKHCREHIFN